MVLRPLIHIVCLLLLVGLFTSCDSDPILGIKQDLCWFTPKGEALDNNATVDGKILVLYRSSNFERGKYGNCELDGSTTSGYRIERSEPEYFPEDMYARYPEEIATLIMIENKKGKYLDPMSVRKSLSRQSDVDVFSGVTEISLIDYKTGNVIRKTRHENTIIPKTVSENRLRLDNSSARYEYVVEPSADELRTYLREISDKAKMPSPK